MEKTRPSQTLAGRFGFQDPDLTTPQHDDIVLSLIQQAATLIDRLSPAITIDLTPDHRNNLKMAIEALKERHAGIIKSIADSKERALIYNTDYWQKRLQEEQQNLDETARQLEDFQKLLEAVTPVLFQTSEKIAQKRCEHPIMNRSYTIGFVDLYVQTIYYTPHLSGYRKPREYPPPAVALPKPVYDDKTLHYYFEVKPRIPSFGELVRQLRMYQSYLNPEDKIIVTSPDERFLDAILGEGFLFLAAHLTDPDLGWRFEWRRAE